MRNKFRPTRAAVPRDIFFLMGSLFFLFGTELEEGTVNKTPIFDMIHEHAI